MEIPDEPVKLSPWIEHLLRNINAGGGNGESGEASLARLQTQLSTTLSRDLQNLTHGIHSLSATLGSRIETLNDQIEESRSQLHASSESATKQSKRLVWVTGFYTLLTAFLVMVSAYQIQIAQNALQAQIEPELIMEVVPISKDGAQIVLRNEGTYSVTNISIDTYDIQFAGPPFNEKLSQTYRLNETIGTPWWILDELKAGEIRYKALEKIGQNALEGVRFFKPSIERGEVPGIPAGSKVQILSFVKFLMVAHRAVDHKRYEKVVYMVVLEQPDSAGKPRFIDPRSLPSLREALVHVKNTDVNRLAP